MSFVFKQNNPKRENTASYDRYERYKTATTLSEMLVLGGTRADYKNDLKKGYIKLEGMADFAPVDVPSKARKQKAPPTSSGPARIKKVKGAPSSSSGGGGAGDAPAAPRQAGFGLFYRVQTNVIRWDQTALEGKSQSELDHARDETNTAVRQHDESKVIPSKVYGDLEGANAAALELIMKLVTKLAVDSPDGVMRPAEEMIVPTEGTIRNGCSTAENGAKLYRTAITFVADALANGVDPPRPFAAREPRAPPEA